MTPRPRLLFYCQHSLGLGHLVRSWAIAANLAEDFEVVVLSGGELPSELPPPAGVRTVALPPLGLADAGLVSLDRARSVEEAMRARQATILDLYGSLRPDVVVIELFPFGRKKFAGELLPLLERAAAAGPHKPLVLCSVRDILVSRGDEQDEHDERARRLADRYFDAVLVHGDPELVRFEDSFRPCLPLIVPVLYTGLVAGTRPVPALERRREIVVSAGGGRVGQTLLQHAADAHADVWRSARLATRIITGPFCPDEAWAILTAAAARQPGLTVERAVPDLAAEMAGSAVSVSQCGYNTALDILRTATPALVVPFGEGLEDEQRRRADSLARRGLLRVLPAERLTPATLADEILATSAFRPAPVDLRLDGGAVTRRIVSDLLAARRRRGASAQTEAAS
jgi:predicted glycosyltransferase